MGAANRGGDSTSVKDELQEVDKIYSNSGAFAAKLTNGHVVTWGDTEHGGDSSSVQDQLKDVETIFSNDDAFAAKITNGSIVTWGCVKSGGNSNAVQAQLQVVDYSLFHYFVICRKVTKWKRCHMGQFRLGWRQ